MICQSDRKPARNSSVFCVSTYFLFEKRYLVSLQYAVFVMFMRFIFILNQEFVAGDGEKQA